MLKITGKKISVNRINAQKNYLIHKLIKDLSLLV